MGILSTFYLWQYYNESLKYAMGVKMKKNYIILLCIMCGIMGMTSCSSDNIKVVSETDNKTESTKKPEASIAPQESAQPNPQSSKKPEVSNPASTGQQSNSNLQGSAKAIVFGGFKVVLPQGVTPAVSDGNIVLSDENKSWEMLCKVTDRSFEQRRQTPDICTEGVRNAGYSITKDISIVTVANREFAYFRYEDSGDNMLLAYSKANDQKSFANQVITYANQSDEDVLNQIAQILANVTETTEPDTTQADLGGTGSSDTGSGMTTLGKRIEETELATVNKEITIGVPKDFYFVEEIADIDDSAKYFETMNCNKQVYLYLLDSVAYNTMEECVEDGVHVLDEAENVQKSGVMKKEVNGRTVYYQQVSYEYIMDYYNEKVTCSEVYAICKMEDDVYLEAQASAREGETIDFSEIEGFFTTK